MEEMLRPSYTKNFKNLAGELGYDMHYVRYLETLATPVEALMDDFVTGRNATKERLYEALLAIERQDVADRVWVAL